MLSPAGSRAGLIRFTWHGRHGVGRDKTPKEEKKPDARKAVTGGPAGRAPGKPGSAPGKVPGATEAKGGGDSSGKDKPAEGDKKS